MGLPKAGARVKTIDRNLHAGFRLNRGRKVSHCERATATSDAQLDYRNCLHSISVGPTVSDSKNPPLWSPDSVVSPPFGASDRLSQDDFSPRPSQKGLSNKILCRVSPRRG